MKRKQSRNAKTLVCAGLLSVLAVADTMAAEIRPWLSGQRGERVRIAVPDFASRSAPGTSKLGRQIAEVIAADLDFSGYFEVMDRLQYPREFVMLDLNPRRLDFRGWSRVGARDLIHGLCSLRGSTLEIDCRLFDVREERQIVGKGYEADADLLRSVAHRFADQVVLAHAGRLGIAHTKLCFTSTSTGNKEIFVCDYDGENVRQLTNDAGITLSPAWSPDALRVAYTSYRAGNPDLYTINADGSSPTMVSGLHGLNTAPCWSPSGDRIALTLTKDGNPELYLKEVNGKRLRRITYDPAIDTSPSFSPDGFRIAFVSDRAGTPQIWVMDIDGRNLRRVSYQRGRSFAPAWSPLGDRIAYAVERAGEGLQIYVMDADGRNTQQLTTGPGWSQQPSWSPSGTHIAFCSDRLGRFNVYTMRADGSDQRRVSFLGGDNEAPAWSD